LKHDYVIGVYCSLSTIAVNKYVNTAICNKRKHKRLGLRSALREQPANLVKTNTVSVQALLEEVVLSQFLSAITGNYAVDSGLADVSEIDNSDNVSTSDYSV